MGLFDKLRGEFVDIVEWIDDSKHTLVWRFPRYQNEIKNGAQLIVRPGQVAVFVHRGQLADAFEPGHYTLTTDNLPILSTIMGWKHGFNSPFRSEVYFVSTKQVTDLKWGTTNPVMLRDPDFGPIRLRAFGVYAMKAIDAKALLKELVGTDRQFDVDEITELMRSIIVSAFSDLLGSQQVAALDLAAKYRTMGDALRTLVCERVDDEYGLEVTQLNIVNISFPEEVEKALDTRTSMGVIGDMGKFQQFQTGQAILAAANNTSGGAASEGLGLGMGMAMAGRMLQNPNLQGGAAPGVGMAPPPAPAAAAWHVAMNGQTFGPYSIQDMAQAAAAGQITPETTVWTAGQAGWSPAGQLPPLAGLFQAASPPPPPPPA